MSHSEPSGTILRLFEVHTKPGAMAALLEKFASISSDVVQNEPGNEGYFFGPDVNPEEHYVAFASLWESLEAVQSRFGENWQVPLLPAGYEDLIETCSVRHIHVGGSWHINPELRPSKLG